MKLSPVLAHPADLRQRIRDRAVEGLSAAFPMEVRGGKLELADVAVHERDFGPESQKAAILEGTSLHEPVKGTLVLRDPSGKVLDRATDFTLLRLPYLTERHTFIVEGNEYQVANQLRMKPGVYTRRRANDELEAAFNLSKGSNFRLSLDPERGHPYMEYGSSRIPLYPILRKLGLPHDSIARSWGTSVATNNEGAFWAPKKVDAALGKLYAKVVHPSRRVHTTPDAQLEAIRSAFAATSMDPEVNETTLGAPHSKVTAPALLAASKRLLDIYRSGDDVDDRDSLAFKTFHSVDDFVKERILLDARAIALKAKARAGTKTGIREILPPAPFSSGVRSFLTSSQLSAIPTEINPMELIDHAVKVTSLGEGGISSERAIPIEARQLHPTHLAILDPVRTPESFSAGVDIRAAMLAHRDEKGNLYTPVRDVKTRNLFHLSAKDLAKRVVAFPGQQLSGLVDVMKDGKVQSVPGREVEFELLHPSQLYSPATNLIPFMESIQGNRATMGSKMQTQALPLVEREVPWVQVGASILGQRGRTPSSFEHELGKLVVPVAPVGGRVVKIDKEYIYIDPSRRKRATCLLKRAEVKRQRTVSGITFRIELEPGDERSGTSPDGKKWKKTMSVAYGHIPRTAGDDGECVDVYLNERDPSWDKVFVVHQRRQDGSPDEDKCMVGFSDEPSAVAAYERHGPSWGLGAIDAYAWEDFRDDYLEDHRKEAADQDLVKVPYETNFPFASKTFLHQDLRVKPGDDVEKDQHLAESNFTRDGTLALGRNMHVAYMPYYGLNSNDAIVISEGAAKKLTSEHMYKEVLDLDPEVTAQRDLHRQWFGAKYTAAQYQKLDADGVVKKGETVLPHDLLIAAVRKGKLTATDALLGNLRKTLATPYRDGARDWHHDFPGEVIDVFKSAKRIVVTVKTRECAVIGDKLSGRYGNKGVISHIVPDHKMVQDEGGHPIDILYTSAGVISRINPAQIIETAVAKVAEKTGKPILAESFSGRDNVKWAKDLLAKHGVKDKETVFDPISGKKIPGVLVGPQYTLRLFKTTDSNYSARGTGGYDVNHQPTKGGDEGAKALGKMEFNALVAHNARNVLREAATLKSEANDEFWRALQLGLPLPPLKTPFVFDKLLAMLQAAGVRVDRRGNHLALAPLTDGDVKKLSSGAILNERLVKAKNLEPERGGFFDPALTGGASGNRWSHIDLAEPIVNPVFADPARRLLGLSTKDFERLHFQEGGAAVKRRLSALDIPSLEKTLRERTKTANGAQLDDAVKQLKYLAALHKVGISPADAYVISKLPVIPPVMRPILPGQGGREMVVGDSNYLYQSAFLHNAALQKQVETPLLPPDEHSQLRRNLFQAVGAVIGTHETDNPKLEKRNVKGLLVHLTGKTTPKSSFFQKKVVKRQQDLTGRGTMVPDGTLGIDEVGIPEEMLWTMFGKLVIGRLVRRGFPAMKAKELVEEKHATARDALLAEVNERPVMFNRAPTLHRYNIIGAYAVPVPGRTIRINPFSEVGLAGDFDGDQHINTVIIEVSEALTSSRLGISRRWLSSRRLGDALAAHINERVGAVHDGALFLCNLEDFPHHGPPDRRGHIEFYEVPEGVRVVAYDETTGGLSLRRVSHWSVHHGRPVEIVNLRSGRQIVTDDDPRAVYGVNSELEFVRARPRDAKGIFVPYAHDLGDLSSSSLSTKAPPDPRLRPTVECDTAFGHLCGTLVGDGWGTTVPEGRGSVVLAADDESIAGQYRQDLLTVFRSPPYLSVRTRVGGDFGPSVRSTKHTLESYAFASWVRELIGHGAHQKHLPPFFLLAPQDYRLGLLAGLLDTDGSVSVSHAKKKPQWLVNYSTSSIRLAQELVLLCKLLSIRAVITSCKAPRGAPAWIVSISTVDLHRLGSLPVACDDRRKALGEFFAGPAPRALGSYSKHDLIPISKAIVERLSRAYPWGTSIRVSLRKALRSRSVSRENAKRILTEHPEFHDEELLRAWAFFVRNERVRWDEVVSFEKTDRVETGYDLTVPGYETFMAVDGTILSNTLQVHTPVLPAAVEDVKRMTLSNLLFADKQRDDLLVAPRMEAMLGLHLATRPPSEKVHRFRTPDQALAAYKRGEVALNDQVELG